MMAKAHQLCYWISLDINGQVDHQMDYLDDSSLQHKGNFPEMYSFDVKSFINNKFRFNIDYNKLNKQTYCW